MLPTVHHHRPSPRLLGRLRNREQTRQWLLPHSVGNPIRLVPDPLLRPVHLARNSSLPDQIWQGGESKEVSQLSASALCRYEYEKSLGTASYIECFKGTIDKRVFTGVTLQSLQQLVGVNFIFYYVRCT